MGRVFTCPISHEETHFQRFYNYQTECIKYQKYGVCSPQVIYSFYWYYIMIKKQTPVAFSNYYNSRPILEYLHLLTFALLLDV